MNETDEFLKQWFNDCIPDQSRDEQVTKINEELVEFSLAKSLKRQREEAIDVYIAMRVLELIFDSIGSPSQTIKRLFDLSDNEIKRKIRVNYARTWVKDERGVYRHVKK